MPSHDVLIIGAGLAGQRAALAAAQAGAIGRDHLQGPSGPLALGRRRRRHQRGAQPRGHVGVARVRHGQGLGLPRRPGRDRDHVPRGAGRDPVARARGRHLPPQRDRPSRHARVRRRLGGADLLRRRHHRPRDPARALRAADEARTRRSTATRSGSRPTCSRTTTGRCVGAICRNLRDGHLEVFNAKTTILASGGAGQAYQPTTNGLIVTGDGIAQAYRIGARLMDMEMIQYHPTTLAGNGLLITEGARGEGAWLLNAEGERFMEKLRAQQARARLARRRLAAPSRPRSTRAAGSRTAPSRSTSPRCRAGARSRRCGRSSTSAATSPASTSPASRSTSSPASTTSWAGSRPTSTARPRSPGCTPPARWPASRSTAATGWAPTRCSTR